MLLGLDIDENGDDDWWSLIGFGVLLGNSLLVFWCLEEYVSVIWFGIDAQDFYFDLIVEDLFSGYAIVVVFGVEFLDLLDLLSVGNDCGWWIYVDFVGYLFWICFE